MRQWLGRLNEREWLLAFLVSFATLFLLYPRLFLGLDYVMGQGIWELQDPAVSPLYFVPSGRMLRHELLTNGLNFLWTSTRGYGQPILGNDIQTAPLFPLTLLLRSLPDPYFWQVFVLARLILLGGFCFLFAREILGRSKTGAFVFMLCFGFAVHVLRWMNHAWQTGLLASVMYLYFSSKLIQEFPVFRFRIAFGVVLSTFCMITSGFPEATIMGAFLCLFILPPQVFSKIKTLKGIFGFLGVFLLLNTPGFLLACPQLLGIAELLHTATDRLSFRAGPGTGQFKSFSIFWSLITRITDGPPPGDIIHFFNLIPMFLFAFGLIGFFSKKRLDWKFAAAAFCFYFYIFKNFKVWPWFNQFIGTLPVLSSVWFFVYFLPLLLFPFAYFASLGADHLLEERFKGWKATVLYHILAFGILMVLARAVGLEPNTSIGRVFRLVLVFMAFVISLSLHPLALSRSKTRWLAFVVVAYLIGELATVRPIHYMKFADGDYNTQFAHALPSRLKRLLEEKGFNPIEMRDRSTGGMFAEVGVTSMNNGSAPIIPPRPNRFINTMFKTWDVWGAAMPVQGQKTPYSYRLVSNNLTVIENKDPNYGLVDDREWEFLGKIETFSVFYDRLALPRAYLATRCMGASDELHAMSLVSDAKTFSLGNAVLENLKETESRFCKNLNQTEVKKVSLLEDKGQTLTLSSVQGPGVLVLNDLYYPDWVLSDQKTGEVLNIKPANYNFRGVVLPESREYELKFEYRPRWLTLSKKLVFSGFIILMLMGVLLPLLNQKSNELSLTTL